MTVKGKKQRTDARILHTAKVLFERCGVEDVTFDDIAREAGLCRTTVFNHFATGEELYAALCRAEVSDVLDYCAESGETGTKLILTLFSKLIDDMVRYPRVMTRLTNNLILSSDAGMIARIEDLVEQNLPPRAGRDAGRTARMILGLYYGLVNHRHIRNLPFDAVSMQRDFSEMLEQLLA